MRGFMQVAISGSRIGFFLLWATKKNGFKARLWCGVQGWACSSGRGAASAASRELMRLTQELWREARKGGHVRRPADPLEYADNRIYILVLHVHSCRGKLTLQVESQTPDYQETEVPGSKALTEFSESGPTVNVGLPVRS